MNALTMQLVRFFCRGLGLLPRAWVRALGWPLGILWFDVLRFRRQVVLGNLRLAFPEWSEAERIRVGRNSVLNTAGNFFEFFMIPSITEKWLSENVVVEGEENLRRVLAKGKGVYALSLHLGHGDLAASALSQLGFKIQLISKMFKNKSFNDLWFYIRQFQGVRFIEAHGRKTPFEILRAIKDNEIVFFVNDQFMGRPYGVEVEFFGKKTGAAFGLAVFYAKTQSPIVPIYAFEGDDGKLHVKIDPEIEVDHLIRDDREQTYALMTQEFTHILEKLVRKHPSDWMWIHRRWKTFE